MRRIGIAIWMCIVCVVTAFGQDVASDNDHLLVIESKKGLHSIGSSVFHYSATTCDFDCALTFIDSFEKSTEDNISLGLTQDVHWFYFDLLDITADNEQYYLISSYPLIDSLSLYVVQDNVVTSNIATGDMYPFHTRPIEHRNFVIPLKLKKHKPTRVYIRARTSSSLQLNLSIQNQDSFSADSIPNELLFGMYFGLILIMSLYNFFIFLSLREVTYIFYSLATLSAGMVYAVLNGYTFQYLWPTAVAFNQVSISYIMSMTGVFSILFSLSFLQLGKYSKLLQKTAWVLVFVCLFAVFITFMFGYEYYSTYIGILTITLALCAILMFVSGIYCWYRGITSARLFIAAWGFYLMGTILVILRNLGFLEANDITSSSAMIGQAVEVVLLSFALADKYRIIRKDKEKAQSEKLKLQESYASELEQQVEERTLELKGKNEEIIASITYAKRIQTAILPPKRLIDQLLPNSFVLYKPKDIVAGDFYWLESVDDLVFFAAADCTGHGVPGAMVSVICNNGLNRSVREFGLRKPGEVLDKTRELVIKEFEKSDEEVLDGMDISLAVINYQTKELQWAGANNPLWIVRKGSSEIEEIKANKQPIGRYSKAVPFTNHVITLTEGDSIYLFSDGFPDQFGGANGKKYKSVNFKKLIIKTASSPISRQKSILDNEFETWRGPHEQIDDVCVIGLKV